MNYKESTNSVMTYLGLERKPVGVKFLFTEEDYNKCDIPERGRKVAYCNSVNLASRGEAMKLRKEHQGCFNGSVALGFNPAPPKMANGEARVNLGIYDNVETSKSVSDTMQFLKEEPFGLVVMPLDMFEEDPDVVIVVGKSYNLMRLIQGYSYHNGYSPNMQTVGLQAVCHDLTTYPYNTEDINITFLCPGTRLVADWQQDEIGIGMAAKHWFGTVEGVEKTTNPFERDNNKKAIVDRMRENGIDPSSIEFGKNYDKGGYSGGIVE